MEVKVKTGKPLRCPACRSTSLEQVEYQREFHPRRKRVVVDLLTLHCQSCGAESARAAQHNENLKRLKARKARYDGLLLGEEIFALRRRYGITQQAAGRIFGKGKIAFSRYENETSYPDETTTRLLELAIEKQDVIRWLADKAGVELPLWQARCEDERKAKLLKVTLVRKDQKTGLAASPRRKVAWPTPSGGQAPQPVARLTMHSDDWLRAANDGDALAEAGVGVG